MFVNEPLMLPVPPLAIPVTVNTLSLAQLNTVPVTFPVNIIVVIVPAEQIVWLAGVATAFGVGFTNTTAVTDAPVQPLAIGVIVKVTATGALVVLVNEPLILPLPLAAIPVAAIVLSLVQLKVVPLTAPVDTIVVIVAAEQMVWFTGVATASGVGFTSTVAVIGVPVQVTPAFV